MISWNSPSSRCCWCMLTAMAVTLEICGRRCRASPNLWKYMCCPQSGWVYPARLGFGSWQNTGHTAHFWSWYEAGSMIKNQWVIRRKTHIPSILCEWLAPHPQWRWDLEGYLGHLGMNKTWRPVGRLDSLAILLHAIWSMNIVHIMYNVGKTIINHPQFHHKQVV